MESFKEGVLEVVRNIPKGKVMTYKEVAKRIGSPKASRAVGNILNKNYDTSIPCHRVIRSDGSIGGYNRGSKKKEELLKKEKVNRDTIKT
ncbi:MAG: MGMT family protein [Candidatus Paceibacterota bacterium]|jgi:O-6-methylguanine DNA methyltransferase